MAQVQPVQSLNIDGNVLQVADLGPKVQALVSVYNEWNQQLADAQNKFALIQAALNDLSRQIIGQVKQDAEEAAAAAADTASPAPATTTEAPAAVSTDASPAVAQTAKE